MKTPTLLLAMLVACGDRTTTDDEEDAPRPPGIGIGGCSNGLTRCDGECVDLLNDDRNCGACGWECKNPADFGGCERGSCPPALWCTSARSGLNDCNGVCASFGQICAGKQEDPDGCGGQMFMFWGDASSNAMVDCESHTNPWEAHAPCDEEIDWTIFVDTPMFTEAVSCCCTQEPPP